MITTSTELQAMRRASRDGRWSAQFEHTVLVTRRGHEVLTKVG